MTAEVPMTIHLKTVQSQQLDEFKQISKYYELTTEEIELLTQSLLQVGGVPGFACTLGWQPMEIHTDHHRVGRYKLPLVPIQSQA